MEKLKNDSKYYDIVKESYNFSLLIIKLYKYLTINCKDYILSKQVLRSWTSVWANIKEAQSWQSRKDFLAKMSISLKEAQETEYWLQLLFDSEYINNFSDYNVILNKNKELIWVLTKIIKTTKKNL